MEQEDAKNAKDDENIREIDDASLEEDEVVGGKTMHKAINEVAESASDEEEETRGDRWLVLSGFPEPTDADDKNHNGQRQDYYLWDGEIGNNAVVLVERKPKESRYD